MNLVPIGDLKWFSFDEASDNKEQKKQEGDIWDCLLWVLEQNGSDEDVLKKYKESIHRVEEEVFLEFLHDIEEGHIPLFTSDGIKVEGNVDGIQTRGDFPELLTLNTTLLSLQGELYGARKSVAKSLHHTFLIFYVLEIDFTACLKGLSTLLDLSVTEPRPFDPQVADLRCKHSPELLQLILKNGGSGLLNNVLNAQLVKISTDTPNEESNERIIAMLCMILADVFPKQLRSDKGRGEITVDTISKLLQANFDLHDATEYPKRRTVSGRITKALDTIPTSRRQGIIAWDFNNAPKAKVRVKSVEVEIETDSFETIVEKWSIDGHDPIFDDKKYDRPLPKVKKISL